MSSGGGSPAHLTLADNDLFLYASNYCSGTISVIAVHEDGALELRQIVHHITDPTVPCEEPQGISHVHQVTFSSNRTILVNDLGRNLVFEYALENGLLQTPATALTSSTTPGAGPRHTLIHPSQRYAFVINELVSSVTSYTFDAVTGGLGKPLQTLSTLRVGEDATDMAAAELQVSSNGKYLYASNRDISSPNRGRSSLVVYRVDDMTGQLSVVQHVDTLGEHPRFFNFFLNETVVLVGNMNSDTVSIFVVDGHSGLLAAVNTTDLASIDSPAHILKLQ